METIGMRQDHADFKKEFKKYESQLLKEGGVNYSNGYLIKIIINLEKRIRELEFKINK